MVPERKVFRVAILSRCCDDWGGSEELWALSIPYLQAAGMQIMLLKSRFNRAHPRIAGLAASGVVLQPLAEGSLPKRVLKKTWEGISGKKGADWEMLNFSRQLRRFRPHLAVIAQSINFDGLGFAAYCQQLGIPYVVICQKAVDFYWPPAHLRQQMRRAFEKAVKSFFVSRHNLLLTEEQFGFRFSNACVIHNPVRFDAGMLPFPDETATLRLACIGRLFIIDKGQDILLRILCQEKWKARPVHISFVGSGCDEAGLKEMASLLQVKQVSFTGHTDNMEAIWQTHHALVLPSRSEGMPLVVLEALAKGRPVIASKAGGTPEYVQEGVNGFLAEANVADFEAAMERAWQHRHRWPQMGAAAVNMIKERVPHCPEKDFANAIMNLLYEN